MPGAARLGDKSKCPVDTHGCTACPHSVEGPATQGSTDVTANGLPLLRVGDQGIHALCCGLNRWVSVGGAPGVFANGRPAARFNDTTLHCGGVGRMTQGSGDVIIGNGQARLFALAQETDAPFVEDIAGSQMRDRQIWRQNMDYLAEKGLVGDYFSKLVNNASAFSLPAGTGPEARRALALEAKKQRLVERQALISKGRERAAVSTGEDREKVLAAADRLELNNRAVERARLAQDVYNDPGAQEPPIGWKRSSNNPADLPEGLKNAVWEHKNSGFRAAFYESEIDGSKVLAYRGTTGSFLRSPGWTNNFQQWLGNKSEQYDRAVDLARKSKKIVGKELEICGHSLGGGLTSAGSIVTESPGFTFNSAGLHPNTIKPYGNIRQDGDKLIHAYYVKSEVLTTVQNPAGNTVVTPVGTAVRYSRQANPVSVYKHLKGEKPLNLQPVVTYDAVGISHELPAVDGNGKHVSITKANPLTRHNMDYVINGIEKQKTDDKKLLSNVS
jgi:uncharacterized Zn-binding protein involved in type VI secretion